MASRQAMEPLGHADCFCAAIRFAWRTNPRNAGDVYFRGGEIVLRTMASKLGVNLPFPLVQADWETLIRGIESKVQAMKDLKKGEEKDEMLNFYSNACMPFRYFKDGSRLRIFHARELYDE